MSTGVLARAYANIALCKYWGKMAGEGNLPATPSISITLKSLQTDTEIYRSDNETDSFIIDGNPVDVATQKRLSGYLDYWRNSRLINGHYSVKSTNTFQAKAGLASSASGYAALAKALSAFAVRKISNGELSRLARIGSGSAARSIPGGLSKLPVGKNPAASLIVAADDLPWGMVIVTVDASEKKTGSREGMELSRQTSPFYKSWLSQSKLDYKAMLSAIGTMDFSSVGEICEANTMAMHACMIATRPSLIYWNRGTLSVLGRVPEWREGGLETYYTTDAGPHVILLCRLDDMAKIASEASRIPGVLSVDTSLPGDEAKIIKKL
jgi:diphosphomevalonate decarboxylase